MTDKTTLVMPGQKLSVPRFVKRIVQVAAACAITAGVALLIVVSSSMLLARGSTARGLDMWFGLVKRSDLQGAVLLTAIVTVLFVYWQRDRERR